MKRAITTALLVALMAGSAVAQQQQQHVPYTPVHPVPPHFEATASLDRREYHLGENVLLHFVIRNTGKAPFKIEHGGDYRGAPRHLRFEVTATAADGKSLALDPYPNVTCFGGMGGTFEVKSNEAFEQSLPLMHYLHFPAPGQYTLRVTHDLGWKLDPTQPSPAATATITFTMPTPQQAQNVVDAMLALPPHPGSTMGKLSTDFGDFSVLRYKVYVPILQRLVAARGGEKDADGKIGDQALRALSRMPDEAAVDALFGLVVDKEGDDAARLAEALSHHVPRPVTGPWDETANRFPSPFSWRPRFAAEARILALRLIDMPHDQCLSYGGDLFRRVGTERDLPLVTRALDRVVPETATAPRIETIFSKRRDSAAALQGAARALLERGATPPAEPTQPGEVVVYLTWLAAAKEKPAGSEQRIATWIEHRLPYVRETAVAASPLPPPAPVRNRLPAIIAGDADVNVRMAAFRLAQSAKLEHCREALVERVAKAPSHWELEAAAWALKEIGHEFDAWQAMAARLDETELTQRLLNSLSRVAKEASGCGWSGEMDPAEAKRLKRRWTAWLAEHADALRKGERISIHDRRLSEDLFPPNFTISTPDGHGWPRRNPMQTRGHYAAPGLAAGGARLPHSGQRSGVARRS